MKNIKLLLFVSLAHKNPHKEFGFDRNFYSTQGQAAFTAVTDIIKESLGS